MQSEVGIGGNQSLSFVTVLRSRAHRHAYTIRARLDSLRKPLRVSSSHYLVNQSRCRTTQVPPQK